MSNYLMNNANILMSESEGVLNETFVYQCLLDKIPTLPMFTVYGDVYGIEVKAGKNSGKTLTKLLSNGKINFAIYLKGLTEGGIANKIYTIPIYLFPRFNFSDIKKS